MQSSAMLFKSLLTVDRICRTSGLFVFCFVFVDVVVLYRGRNELKPFSICPFSAQLFSVIFVQDSTMVS